MLPSSAVTGSTGSECVIGQRSSATASSTALFVPLKLLRRTVLGGVALTKIKRMSGGKYSNNIV